MEPIKEICAWCNKVTREGSLPASHGCCPECVEMVLRLNDSVEDTSVADCTPVGNTVDARD